MSLPSSTDLVIIGAGVTGLVLARRARQAGIDVLILERNREPGGLLSSVVLDTLQVDAFYHHFFVGDTHLATLLEELGLHHRVTWRATSVALLDSSGLHPLTTPLDVLRFSGLSLFDKARIARLMQQAARRRSDPRLDELSAEEWVIKVAGSRVWKRFVFPLVQGKFGDHWREISAAWLAGRISSRSDRGFRGERLGYLLPGFFELSAVLANDAGESLVLGTPATGLEVEDGRVRGVEAGEHLIRCRSVAFTGGANALRSFLGDNMPHIMPAISGVRFQGIVCGVFRVTKEQVGSYWTNVTVPGAPFNVFVQQGRFGHGAGALPVVYASRYGDPEGVPIHRSKNELDSLQDGLDRFFGIRPRDVRDRTLAVTDDAGPVFTTGFASVMRELSSTVAGFHVGGMLTSYPDRSIEQSIIAAERLARAVQKEL